MPTQQTENICITFVQRRPQCLQRWSNIVQMLCKCFVLTEYFESFNPYPAKLINLNFQPLEVVSGYRDPQLQVAENYLYLFDMIFKQSSLSQ